MMHLPARTTVITAISASLFTCFAVAVMSYIAIATPIGPWIEIVVALLCMLSVKLFCSRCQDATIKQFIGLTTAAAGVGGIVAVVSGFIFPTLYFLDAAQFNAWLATPWTFALIIGSSIMVGGSYALMIAGIFRNQMLTDTRMPFPIGRIVAETITAYNQVRKALELVAGLTSTFIINGLSKVFSWFPSSITVLPTFKIGPLALASESIPINIMLLFVAIGFVAGDLLVAPLITGICTKLVFLEPLQKLLFADISPSNVVLAFGGGMLFLEALFGLLKLPVKKWFIALRTYLSTCTISLQNLGPEKTARPEPVEGLERARLLSKVGHNLQWCHSFATQFYEHIAVVFLCIAYLWYFEFSILAILYIMGLTAVFAHQLLIIGGKTGIAPFGRFSTAVMLPGFIIFQFTSVQITLVSLFVSFAGAIAVDLMFGHVMGRDLGIPASRITKFQILGLCISALIYGLILMLLINHFGLGSPELSAQRGQARALLTTAAQFNWIIVALGAFFCLLLHRTRINATLVFTGLFFPIKYSILLVAGGIMTYFVESKQAHEPFWSGVFAAGALWIILSVFI
jgi:hypothetical protein